MYASLVRMVMLTAVSFGLQITNEQQVLLLGTVEVALALVTNAYVEPNTPAKKGS
jgi:hypothetical protein